MQLHKKTIKGDEWIGFEFENITRMLLIKLNERFASIITKAR